MGSDGGAGRPGAAARLYRWILGKAPGDFREEYGDEMLDDFLRRRREAGGALARYRITARELAVLHSTCRRLSRQGTKKGNGMMTGDTLQDVRFGARTLIRNRTYAVLAILTLALGIGGTTGIFTVVRGVLLKPLPYPSPDRLVRIYPQDLDRGLDRTAFSVPDFRDWERESTRAASMSLYTSWPTPLTGGESPVEINLVFVTGGFFPTLGGAPALGRYLAPDEGYGDNRVVVLSHGLWARQFGSDPSIVGRTISLDHEPSRVVGVAPPDFAFPSEASEAWTFISTIPQSSIPTERRFVRFANGVARLAEGATQSQLTQELSEVAAQLEQRFPESNTGLRRALVEPLQDAMVGNVAASLWVLLGAVGFILVIACVNVASLVLARSSTRDVEIAVRSALGAPRGRVVRQLLVEGSLLGLAGAVLGVVLARIGVDFFMARSAAVIPRATDVAIDGGVLAFTVGLAGLAVLLFGLFPALATSRVDLSSTLREGGRDGGATKLARTMPRILITTEVALSLTLLVGAGLLIRSLTNLQRVDPGFEPQGALAVTLNISTSKHPDFMPLYRDYMDRLARLPTVQAVGSIRTLPLRGEGERLPYMVPGVLEPEPGQEPFAMAQPVSPGAFEALGIPLLEGRGIQATDRADAAPAVVVSESLAREYFPGESAVGKTVRFLGSTGPSVPIVGVVGDVRQTGLADPLRHTFYVSQEQVSRAVMSVVVRTTAQNPLDLVRPVREEMHNLDPDQAISRIETLDQMVASSIAQPRFFALVLTLFSTVATALAAIGVYSVISYHVSQRTPELGLRMALGAGAGSVTRRALAIGMVPALTGVALGLLGAGLLSRTLESLLFGVGGFDPATYGFVAGGLVLVSLLASWIPARRAGRVDPALVLTQ